MNVKKNVCNVGVFRKLIDEGRVAKENFYSRVIVLALVCLFSATKLSAFDFESDGLCFNIVSEEDRTVEVTWRDYGEENSDYVKGDLTIPRKVTNGDKTYTVTKINAAFMYCSGLTSVSIPNSVTEIGGSAFNYCSGLASVSIPNLVTEIGAWAFAHCSGLTSVDIPNSVTEIGGYAFDYCSGLTSIDIPNSVTEIGEGAFSHCRSLTSVVIPNSVTNIRNEAFMGCSGLTSVDIPNSVTKIANGVFYGCHSLISVDIPNSVTVIGDYAFDHCIALPSVIIPNSVTEIGNETFAGCNLEFIYCMATVPPLSGEWDYKAYSNTKLYVPQGSLDAYKSTDPWSKFFTIEGKDFSGIDGVEVDADAVRVTVDGGCIRVSGMAEDATVEVYDLTGRRIYTGAESTIDGLSSGVYVVRVAGKPHKVVVGR